MILSIISLVCFIFCFTVLNINFVPFNWLDHRVDPGGSLPQLLAKSGHQKKITFFTHSFISTHESRFVEITLQIESIADLFVDGLICCKIISRPGPKLGNRKRVLERRQIIGLIIKNKLRCNLKHITSCMYVTELINIIPVATNRCNTEIPSVPFQTSRQREGSSLRTIYYKQNQSKNRGRPVTLN